MYTHINAHSCEASSRHAHKRFLPGVTSCRPALVHAHSFLWGAAHTWACTQWEMHTWSHALQSFLYPGSSNEWNMNSTVSQLAVNFSAWRSRSLRLNLCVPLLTGMLGLKGKWCRGSGLLLCVLLCLIREAVGKRVKGVVRRGQTSRNMCLNRWIPLSSSSCAPLRSRAHAHIHTLTVNNVAGARCAIHTEHSGGLIQHIEHCEYCTSEHTRLDPCTSEDRRWHHNTLSLTLRWRLWTSLWIQRLFNVVWKCMLMVLGACVSPLALLFLCLQLEWCQSLCTQLHLIHRSEYHPWFWIHFSQFVVSSCGIVII